MRAACLLLAEGSCGVQTCMPDAFNWTLHLGK